jgi:ABC-type oligopeptide transport system ATPase subunit
MTYVSGSLLARRVVRAVDDVSLRLEAGRPEIVTIIGESGSGKSTLARMILNLATPTDGVIRFLGTDVAKIRGSRARTDFMRQVQRLSGSTAICSSARAALPARAAPRSRRAPTGRCTRSG